MRLVALSLAVVAILAAMTWTAEQAEPVVAPAPMLSGVASSDAFSARVFARSRPAPVPGESEVRADRSQADLAPSPTAAPVGGSIWAEGADFAPPET